MEISWNFVSPKKWDTLMVAQGCVWLLQGGMHGWSGRGGVCGWSRGMCMVARGVRGFSQGGRVWDMTRYADMVNERAVCILLECILVVLDFRSLSGFPFSFNKARWIASILLIPFNHNLLFYFLSGCKIPEITFDELSQLMTCHEKLRYLCSLPSLSWWTV